MILKSQSEPIQEEEVVELGEQEVPAGEGEAAAHVETQPRKSRRERAIDRATAELRRENEDLRRRLEAAQPPQRAAQAEPVAARPKPRRAEFANDEAFEDALVAWGNEKFAAEKAVADAQATQRQHDERIVRNYGAQVQAAREAHPDWDELKAKFDAEDIFIGHATQLAILEDEAGAEITYYLMRHPAEAAELGKMSQVKAIKKIDRLSAKLTGAASGEEYERRPRPKVPAPVRTVNTGGSNAVLTFAEIAAKPNYPGKARDLRAAQVAGR